MVCFEIYHSEEVVQLMSGCVRYLIGSSILFLVAAGCSGKIPKTIGVHQSGLSDCPKSPNCVSTEAREASHKIEPFHLKGDPKAQWSEVIAIASTLPRSTVIKSTENYIHLECRSLVFRFVDDLELHLRPAGKVISVRSASRIGKSDFGVNRKRVELLRRMLREKNIIE